VELFIAGNEEPLPEDQALRDVGIGDPAVLFMLQRRGESEASNDHAASHRNDRMLLLQ
jgi:hypothetical protein